MHLQYEHTRLEFEEGSWPPSQLEVYVGEQEIDEWIKQDLQGFPDGQVQTRLYNRLAKTLKLPCRKILSRDEFYSAITEAEQAGQ